MSQFTATIDGAAVATKTSFAVHNPATNDVLAHAPECSHEHVDAALSAAVRAFASWREDADERRRLLLLAADALKAAANDIGPVLTAEQGKPLREATGEVLGVAAMLRYYARLDLPVEVVQDDEHAYVEVGRRPLGPVVAITAWNFPLSLAGFKIAPALAAGNTVVLKPSPFTPLATLRMGEVLREVLPPGVLNVVSGPDPLGAWLIEHPLTRKVTFTGSIATGKKVAAAAGADLKRLTLELGGNDPAIVLDDADAAEAASKIFWAAFGNCGQVCSAVKRVYVPRRLEAEFVEVLSAKARAVRVGDGMAEGTQMGPVSNRSQFDRVSALVADALASGGRAAAGGGPLDGPGNFFAPTVLTDVTDGVAVVDEEQFGPVLPVVVYDDLDDALLRANATHFGLGASVWGVDADRLGAVAARLDAGTVWINAHLRMGREQPYGGAKSSGTGLENGRWGMLGFTDVRVTYRSR